MITLSSESKLVRFAYFGSYKPERTSLCKLFWMAALRVYVLLAIVVGMVQFIMALITDWLGLIWLTAMMLAVVYCGAKIVGWACELLDDQIEDTIESWSERSAAYYPVVARKVRSSLIFQYMKALKDKTCPLVLIKQ